MQGFKAGKRILESQTLVGKFDAYRDGCKIIGRAASKKKELVVVQGASQYDLYDKPEPVRQALAKLIPFYKENMG